ncbi:MAG: MaoC family dehydratase N-terminal domain-containing protein [Lacisediminimonas sp.]|nr:MaoC family dehydratase N-terminal domain-containing protein [Lacisediminimonas sp.]
MDKEAFDLTLLRQWVGRTETLQDVVNGEKLRALAGTLDREPPADNALPPLWHWTHFWPIVAASQTGEDGHPRRGGFLPPVPLPRRMWAGGRLQFSAPLPVGTSITRTSRILDVNAKSGSTGQLAFVTVRHEISANGSVAVSEEHDIVYRDLPPPGVAPVPGKPAPEGEAWSRLITPDPVLLFRYSALTFNGHRIHYDRSYVTEVEGYPGLIVHGPLIATLLVDLLHRNLPQAQLSAFSFRGVGPLFDIEPFTVCGQPQADGKTVKLWAKNMRGELAMQADAVIA